VYLFTFHSLSVIGLNDLPQSGQVRGCLDMSLSENSLGIYEFAATRAEHTCRQVGWRSVLVFNVQDLDTSLFLKFRDVQLRTAVGAFEFQLLLLQDWFSSWFQSTI
jgi:hypothetical protein